MNELTRLREIALADGRYALEAYLFVLEALQFTREKFQAAGHVTGQQLLEGIKDLALEQYGAMAKLVFEHWGIEKTRDFGNIVINMVNERILSKTAEDKIEDFDNIYNFEEVFVKDYELTFGNEKGENISPST